MKLDRIIIGVNDNHLYLQNWPLVAQLWARLFPEARITLGLLTDSLASLPVEYMNRFGEIAVFKPVPEIPIVSQSRIIRHYIATLPGCADEIIMLNDIDLLPLQREYYEEKLSQMQSETEMLAIGGDFYRRYGKKCAGKFPMGYATASGRVWREVMNPENRDWPEFVRQFNSICVLDRKESVLVNDFCDESLLRALLMRWGGPVRHLPMGFVQDDGRRSISRWKPFDIAMLERGEYVEAHHLLPMSGYMEIIRPICKKFKIEFDENWLSSGAI